MPGCFADCFAVLFWHFLPPTAFDSNDESKLVTPRHADDGVDQCDTERHLHALEQSWTRKDFLLPGPFLFLDVKVARGD